MFRIGYALAVFLYIVVGISYFEKFEISYQIVKVRPELVEIRSLTNDEYKALDRAYQIRIAISTIFEVSSFVIALLSYLLLRYKVQIPILLLRIIISISLFIGIALWLIDGINFIPTGPLT